MRHATSWESSILAPGPLRYCHFSSCGSRIPASLFSSSSTFFMYMWETWASLATSCSDGSLNPFLASRSSWYVSTTVASSKYHKKHHFCWIHHWILYWGQKQPHWAGLGPPFVPSHFEVSCLDDVSSVGIIFVMWVFSTRQCFWHIKTGVLQSVYLLKLLFWYQNVERLRSWWCLKNGPFLRSWKKFG